VAEQKIIFAANRATGGIALTVGARGGRTRRGRVHEDGSLRVRFPNVEAGAPLEAVIVNTGGGMTGGDCFSLDVAVGPGASLSVTTAAAEKIYRSLGADALVDVALKVADGGSLSWLPQETILFDKARYARRIDVDLAEDASLVLAEAVVFGRAAMGEVVVQGSLADRWRVRRDGRLVFAENVRLYGDIAASLAQPAVAKGNCAVATVLVAPGTEAQLTAVRVLADQFAGAAAISAWNGIAVARLCARDGAALRHDLALVLHALGAPLPRLWLN
jgi:urease accessory protein